MLVCTDSAARGIDIPGVTHVVQADFAATAIDFLHRARALPACVCNVPEERRGSACVCVLLSLEWSGQLQHVTARLINCTR